ncbi:MAG: hypothetical protein ACOH14_01610 [Rhodoglobus sp.]
MTPTPTSRAPNGAVLILAATLVAGIAGYLVTFIVYRQVGAAPYALFAVFWAAMYLVIGALSGVQQEITRATRPIALGARSEASRARNFAVVLALIVAILIIATGFLWADAVFADDGWALVWPLAAGAASYVLVATLSGSLYGVSQWPSLALMIATDGVIRLALLSIALQFTSDIVVLAWTVSLPFPLAIALLWPLIRGRFVGRSDLDVGYRGLSWNVARTVLASASTAVLVSGFPLLLGVAAASEDPALLGELIFTITLTRAPLIVTIMSLQGFLVVRFRDEQSSWLRLFLLVQGGIVGATIVFAPLGWWLGPPVFALVSGRPTLIDGSLIAILVLSSGLVAALSTAAAAVLAKGKHVAYSLGWLGAAAITIAIMLAPGDFIERVSVALIVGPIVGLVFHCVALSGMRRAVTS